MWSRAPVASCQYLRKGYDVASFGQAPGGGVANPPAGFGRGDTQADEQVGLAGSASDSDRLQHLRSVLPCEVRVTVSSHPLFGRLLAAGGFKRLDGVVFLVVQLPDGSPGTIRADATDVFGAVAETASAVFDVDGLQALYELVGRLRSRLCRGVRPGEDK